MKNKAKERFVSYIKRVVDIIKRREMGILPGQLAFFMLLSLVPIITLCGYAAGYIGINLDTIVKLLNDYVPGGASYLVPYIKGSTIDIQLGLMFIWMFYLASNGFNSVILVSNQIYGLNNSNWFKRRIKAIIMTISMVILLIFILLVPVFGDSIIRLLSFLKIDETIYIIFNYIRTPLIWIVIFLYVRTLYEVSPDRTRKNSHINVGALFTCIGWVVVTYVYRFLSLHIGNYNFFYGALSSIAFLMLWIYFMSFVFVIGLILNHGSEEEQQVLDKTGAVKVVKGY